MNAGLRERAERFLRQCSQHHQEREWYKLIQAFLLDDHKKAIASVPPEAPRITRDPLSPEEIERLCKLPMGPIEVVYPLDEEWNAAVEACAAIAVCAYPDDGRDHAECPFCSTAKEIRALKRTIPSPLARSQEKT